MPKPTMEASLADRNEKNVYDFLTNLGVASVFQDDAVTKERSGLSDEALEAINDYDISKITLADILAYANATNFYLDLNTDLDS